MALQKVKDANGNWVSAVPQADYAENDPNAPGYVKNRPFYEDGQVVQIWADDAPTLMRALDGDGISIFGSMAAVAHMPVDGNEYTVTHNGVTSTSKCVYMPDEDDPMYALGNIGLMSGGDDTGETYVILFVENPAEDDMTVGIIDISNINSDDGVAPTSCSVAVEGLVGIRQTIDEKFLPKSAINVTPDWNAGIEDKAYIEGRTHYVDKAGDLVFTWKGSLTGGELGYEAHYNAELRKQCRLKPGCEYEVCLNDTHSYILKASRNESSNYMNCPVYLGDGALENMGAATGHEFLIAIHDDYRHAIIRPGNLSFGTLTKVQIFAREDIYHEIDRRFLDLPEGTVVTTPDWNADEGEDGHILNRTHWKRTTGTAVSRNHLINDGQPVGTSGDVDGNYLYYMGYTGFPVAHGTAYRVTFHNATHVYVASVNESTGSVTFYPSSGPSQYLWPNIYYTPDTTGTLADGTTQYNIILMTGNYINKFFSTNLTICVGNVMENQKETKLLTLDYLPELTSVRRGLSFGSAYGGNSANFQVPCGENSFAYGDAWSSGFYGAAFGYSTEANGNASFAACGHNHADGLYSAALNSNTLAEGEASLAEGRLTEAIGTASHAEGQYSIAEGNYAHAEGLFTAAVGNNSHAEGNHSYAFGGGSHAEGTSSSSGESAHAEGNSGHVYRVMFASAESETEQTLANEGLVYPGCKILMPREYDIEFEKTITLSNGSEIYTNATTEDWFWTTVTNVDGLHVTVDTPIGDDFRLMYEYLCVHPGAVGDCSHTEGSYTTSGGAASHAEGQASYAIGLASHAEGMSTVAAGVASHAEGGNMPTRIFISGDADATTYTWHHTSGTPNLGDEYPYVRAGDILTNYASELGPNFAEDKFVTVVSVDGDQITVDAPLFSKALSDAECWVIQGGIAQGICSHSEGFSSVIGTTSYGAHAEGYVSRASANGAHAEGGYTIASGKFSHAEGANTIAASDYQHVEGKGNLIDADDKYAHIVGNGRRFDDNANETNPQAGRSNAYTLDWNGNGWYAGEIEASGIILRSSTSDSTKKFRITVDDSGVLTATEIV